MYTQKMPVVFTFDDGGISFYKVIAPIIEKYGIRGIFFISTGYIGTEGFLSAEQIADLHERGHIIGSHSHSHPENMAKLSAREIAREWALSDEILAKITGGPIVAASIPNGFASKQIYRSMIASGITELYTSDPTTDVKFKGTARIIGRFAVTNDMSAEYVLSMIADKSVRRKRYLRFKALSLCKAILGDSYLKIRKKILR